MKKKVFKCPYCKNVYNKKFSSLFCADCNKRAEAKRKLSTLLLNNFDDVCNVFSIASRNLSDDSPKFKKDILRLKERIFKSIGKI